jgi:hypothetical protein
MRQLRPWSMFTLAGHTDHGYPTMSFFSNRRVPLTLGQRIRLRREPSLNTTVAWMVQHSAELIAFAAHSRSGSRRQPGHRPLVGPRLVRRPTFGLEVVEAGRELLAMIGVRKPCQCLSLSADNGSYVM